MQQCVLWCLKKLKEQRSIDSCVTSTYRTVCHSEVCTRGQKCLKAAETELLMHTGEDAHPHAQSNKTRKAQAMILGNCKGSAAYNTTRMGINDARPWC
jgi:hypothetical protein